MRGGERSHIEQGQRVKIDVRVGRDGGILGDIDLQIRLVSNWGKRQKTHSKSSQRDGPLQIRRCSAFRRKRGELCHFIPADVTSIGDDRGIDSAQR